jgi:hypothetical protein
MAPSGFVFDTYDDSDGTVLREILPDVAAIPDFVKEAHRITSDEAHKIPDDNYALVLIEEGQQFPKYATVDKGNTALSVMYLLKQAHLLPAKAVKIAATNLIEACSRYELAVPEQLKIAAASGVSGVSGKSQQPFIRKALNAALERKTDYPVPEVEKETTINPQLGRGGVEDDVKTRANVMSVQGTNFMTAPAFSGKERLQDDHVKTAAAADAATMALLDADASTHEKNWRVSPYVDMQDWEPGATLEKEASAAPRYTLLRGKYPVDDYGQVKLAAAYFTEHVRRFHPRDRREYCTKLAERMVDLDIEPTEQISKYASASYGADVEAYVSYRKSHVPEEFHPALDTLMSKQAMVSPETFAEALCEFDETTNLSHEWDARIPDPWTSTFGDSLEKTAAENWVFDEQGVRLDEEDLTNLTRNSRGLVVDAFGEKFADEMTKSPKTFFNALPLPNKIVLGRMAMDRHSGTGSE